jgi:hypothetical protein
VGKSVKKFLPLHNSIGKTVVMNCRRIPSGFGPLGPWRQDKEANLKRAPAPTECISLASNASVKVDPRGAVSSRSLVADPGDPQGYPLEQPPQRRPQGPEPEKRRHILTFCGPSTVSGFEPRLTFFFFSSLLLPKLRYSHQSTMQPEAETLNECIYSAACSLSSLERELTKTKHEVHTHRSRLISPRCVGFVEHGLVGGVCASGLGEGG